jgi:HK97 family phage prohead protease
MSSVRRVKVRGGPRMSCQMTDMDASSNLKTLTGRAAPYDVPTVRGWHILSFAQGCFDKSIKEAARNLPLLLWHEDKRFPIGSNTVWTSKADGLWGEWTLDDAPEAQRAAKLAQSGVLTGLSVAWQPILNDWQISDMQEWSLDDTSTLDRCTLLEGRLLETSMVTIPQWDQAHVTLVASRRDTPAPDARPALDRWKSWRSTL